MKAQLECIPCIMKQALNTARRATNDLVEIRTILAKTAEYVATLNLDTTPADASNYAYRVTSEVTGVSDPYEDDKKRYNELCLEKTPALRKAIDSADDPIRTAVRLAILGNVIDMGIGYSFDLEAELDRVLNTEFAIDDYGLFRRHIDGGGKRILYLGDNAGEIVFDRLLIERLIPEHEVTFVVKRGPIINDATMEDAKYVGLTDMVEVIDTGSNGIGVKWDAVSDAFLERYEASDIIISKGQGNFETNSERDKDTYFLLKAKCDCVAEVLGVSFGDIVFRKGPVR